jgi:hypothetical protein
VDTQFIITIGGRVDDEDNSRDQGFAFGDSIRDLFAENVIFNEFYICVVKL